MFHLNNTLFRISQLKASAESRLDKALASGRDLTGAELTAHNSELAEIKKLSQQLDEYRAGKNPDPNGPQAVINMEGSMLPRATNQRHSFGNSLREVYASADAATRAEIDAFASVLSGRRITATADLRPSGDGGLIIPSAVQAVMERNFSAFSPVASIARLFPTEAGEPTTFPVLSDSETAVQLDAAASTGADATVSGDTPPTTITGPTLKAWKVSSKPVFVPRELTTDSPVEIIQEVIGALLARIIRFENLKYTKGAGTTEAEGFLLHATAMTITLGSTLDLDVALDLAYNVPALYRPQGVFMMSDTTAKYLRKLKTGLSGDKRQLWADADATKGTPATLHGYSVVINNDMDDVSADGTFASKNPLAFGDFSRFVVRQAENNQAFSYIYPVPAKDGRAAILFRRSDSKLIVPTAISKLAVATS